MSQSTRENSKMMKHIIVMVLTTTLIACATTSNENIAAEPKYKADVPANLITPDSVNTTLLGVLTFSDGMPSEQTVKKSYDFLDTTRATQAFLKGLPAVSIHSMLEGLKLGGAQQGDLMLWENLMDARSLLLSPNTTTPYAFAEINLKNGPVVLNLPPMVLGAVDNAYFLHVSDVGITGPDKGKGGQYLFIGPDYKGDIPDGYHVVYSKTYRHWLFMRTFVKNNNIAESVRGLKEHFQLYPLAQADNPPKQNIINASGKKINTIHPNNIEFFDELNAVVQYEPANAFKPEHVGLFASIGIKKGKKYSPDVRMKKILTDAAAIANATARSITFQPRSEHVYFYPGQRRWYSPLAGGSSSFMKGDALMLDDRIMFHYYATGITPAMAMRIIGKGSAYALTAHDAQGNYLDGSKTYSVTLPSGIPAKDFWSLMVYDNQTRSILETDQKAGGIDGNAKNLQTNDDGSVTLYFGPLAPIGNENNWVQTMPNKGFNVLLRLYGPLESWFDKTWMPGDFELSK